MKTRIHNLFIAFGFAVGFCFSEAKATTIFPIATNGIVWQLGFSAAFSGSNYLVGIEGNAVDDDITAQLISTNGSMAGPRIALERTGGIPATGFDGTNFMLLWSDDALHPFDQVYGQRVSPTGGLIGNPFTFGPPSQNQSLGGIAWLAFDGRNYLAVWNTGTSSSNTTNGDVHAALFTPAGSLVVPVLSITSGAIAALTPSVAFGKTNYLVVWENRRAGGTELYDIYGEFISTNGTQGSAFLISQTPTPSHNPLMAAFDGTNFLAVWNKDIGSGYPNPAIWNIYGRVVSPAETFPGNEVAMVTDTNNPVYAALAWDGANYLMMWHAGSTNSQIVFQFFNRSASAIGPEFTLFSPQGTNSPVLGSVLFDGRRFAITAIMGGFGSSGFTSSSSTWGTFIPNSTALPMVAATGELAGTQFSLQLTGTPGVNYAIQAATNLPASSWLPLVTNTPTNGTFIFTDLGAPNRSRFYRAVKE